MEGVTITMDVDLVQWIDVDFVQWIMNEISDKAFKRKDVAHTYSILLQKGLGSNDMRRINAAIIDRWSPGGLRWIKEQAWKEARAIVV